MSPVTLPSSDQIAAPEVADRLRGGEPPRWSDAQGLPLPEADSPWRRRDILRAGWIVGVGVVALTICWYGASGEPAWHDALPWLVGAILASVFAAIGLVSWLLAGFSAVRAQERAMLSEIATVLTPALAAMLGQETDAVLTTGLVTVAGSTKFHHGECQLVRGKPVTALVAEAISGRGLSACGVCHE
ncbi:hypothetical protein [Sporichthya sp.]|uniref:hypothetical protein n=1 Tax=Sporichthya sp. TaxID=65475 RepID=UPI0017B84490|nr:hypothetical protein [Sporichthya sp.]MBA3743285.1 hypothetical protein [Sporichthya sp.]